MAAWRGFSDALSDEYTISPAGDDPPQRFPLGPTGRARARQAAHLATDLLERPAPPPRVGVGGAATDGNGRPPNGGGAGGAGDDGGAAGPEPNRPRVYKLRLALILAGLGGLAVVSTVFGMMMAVASELPALEKHAQYRNARNSVLLDVHGRQFGVLTGGDKRILVQPGEVSPAMQHAVIAVEDKRFYENNGIDVRGIARALIADIARRRTVQGASTIAQQFVKNAMAAQNERTLFQKLRESALAYHLNRKWSKRKILTEYLNAVYFGNGAYGIESAARTYFGFNHKRTWVDAETGEPQERRCGDPGEPNCASLLTVSEAATLAGMVISPSAYDPVTNPEAAIQRRNVVLRSMLEQRYITRDDYKLALDLRLNPLPDRKTVEFPREDSIDPRYPQAAYFTTWAKQQLIERLEGGAGRALNGGLQIRTTLDLDLQRAAERAVISHLSNPDGPVAALVAIDNRTGEVRAMVGGRPSDDNDQASFLEYNKAPFNLATQGQRQPGSAFKVFTLAQALREGISPYSTWESRRKIFDLPTSGPDRFVVRNYEGQYSGITTLANATAESDNSVYAELGIKLGTGKIAKLAREMGIRTPVSSNYAMTLGGLEQGVTPLDMAHAYQTVAAGGKRVTGTLGAANAGPVGLREIRDPRRNRIIERNRPIRRRVVSQTLADMETEILKSVICCGTGKSAAIDGFAAGKTGTTENYGDAWFVGYNKRWTVAVWVGYPDRLKSMKWDYGGSPVVGGSYPASIWRDFILAADQIQNQREAEKAAREGREYEPPDESGEGGTTTGEGTETTQSGEDSDSSAPAGGDDGGGEQSDGSGSPSPGSGDGGGGGGGAPPPSSGSGGAGATGGSGAPPG
jgi:penicillin-binding protein 1A